MVTVSKKAELAKAVKNKENTIVVTGDLVNKLKPIAKVKGNSNIHEGMTKGELISAGALAESVMITLIITVGIVVIVAIIFNYNVRLVVNPVTGENEMVLERK